MHNSLSRGMERLPAWILQTVVGMLLTGSLAWATWATTTDMKQQTIIEVTDQKVSDIRQDIAEIKDGQKETNSKLDRLIERRR